MMNMHGCPIKGMARYLSWGREGKQEHIGIVAEIKKKDYYSRAEMRFGLKIVQIYIRLYDFF